MRILRLNRGGGKPEQLEESCLVVTDDREFFARVELAARECQWKIRHASSFGVADAMLREGPVPIVVYDRDLSEGDWQQSLARLHSIDNAVCVILASRVADDYLLQEVVENQGYDILAKSAGPEIMIRTLRFAWFWRRSRHR